MTCFSALRYRLLELALSGRLLPQQDSEPVVKPKNVSPALDEVPFALPNKWQWYQLNDLGQVFRGRTPSDKTENWDNPTIPWITGTDLHANQSKGVYIWEGACGITEQGLLETYAKLVPIGAVIYTITGFNIGDIAITARECSINNSCYAYVPDFELEVGDPKTPIQSIRNYHAAHSGRRFWSNLDSTALSQRTRTHYHQA